MKTKQLSTSFFCMMACSASLQAAALIYEPFDYNTGDLSTNSGWSDSGSVLAAGSLTYNSLPTAGNRVTHSDDTSWMSTGAALNGALDNGDTLWFSVLVNPGVVGTNPDLGFALATERGLDKNNVGLASSGNGLGFRVKRDLRASAWNGGSSSLGSPNASVSAGTTYLIVGEMVFGANNGATDTVNIYLPDSNLDLGAVVTTQTATLDQTQFDTITFMNKTANPRDQIDEIRFGATSDDVLGIIAVAIPEPSSSLLLSLGAILGLTARRRR